ncbi:MAG: hypothetical protein KDC80_27105, partial [Saprospiraceae bacterium]|nr:hypothetical protein [Saprospiraceae bacterium]
VGAATIREAEGQPEAYLQLQKGQGLILLVTEAKVDAEPWPYLEEGDTVDVLDRRWSVRFVDGGPELPPDLEMENLQSWSAMDSIFGAFSGRAIYQTEFSEPDDHPGSWILDLGEVYESAHVFLNDRDKGTLIGPQFRLRIDADELRETNRLEIHVSNLMANRIIDMDKKNIYWKKFYNVNFPPRRAENRGENGLFDASGWEPLPSGLLGPVRLIEGKEVKF